MSISWLFKKDMKKNEKIQALIEVLKSDEIKQFVEDEYKGAVVMVD